MKIKVETTKSPQESQRSLVVGVCQQEGRINLQILNDKISNASFG